MVCGPHPGRPEDRPQVRRLGPISISLSLLFLLLLVSQGLAPQSPDGQEKGAKWGAVAGPGEDDHLDAQVGH